MSVLAGCFSCFGRTSGLEEDVLSLLEEYSLTGCVVRARTTGYRLGESPYGFVDEVIVSGVRYAAKVPTVHSNPVTQEPDTIRNVNPHLKECQLMSKLGHHPNIIKFVGICFLSEFPKLPAMIMEKVPYGNLHNYLKKQGPANSMELSRKRHILLGVANGLHYLHYECEMAVVHMDLKASIVLLNESYDAKISGFRKACMVSDKELASNNRYDPDYMPPEVISHAETTRCTPTIDIFSFGVLALFTLNQELPRVPILRSNSDSSEVEWRRDYLIQLESSLSVEARRILPGLIIECLDNDPSKRPTSKKLIEALGNIETNDTANAQQREKNQRGAVAAADNRIDTGDMLFETKGINFEHVTKYAVRVLREVVHHSERPGGTSLHDHFRPITLTVASPEPIMPTFEPRLEPIQPIDPPAWVHTNQHHDIDKKIRHTFKFLPSVSTYYQCSQNIASVPFLTEVEVLTCDSSGCEYYNYDHGIMLRIPDDAIPPGMVIHLEVAVALYGPFQFPDGSCPVSPILWLCIQENIDLRKPLDIILPHFLTDKNIGIRFAKADHKQYATDEFGQTHYVFEPLETAFIAYKERNQNYGILSTQHCCYLCIISKDPQISPEFALKAGYYLWCIEKPSSNLKARDTVHFCVTFCLPTCRELLKSQYTEDEGYYIRRPPKVFAFEVSGDTSISESCLSVEVKNEGCLRMAADPENKLIKASQVYFWDKLDKLELLQADKVYPPGVILTLEVLENLPVNLLIKFNGSTADYDMGMEIMLPLASVANKSCVGPTSSAIVDHKRQWISTADKPELRTVLRELIKVDSKWENIGIFLEVDPHRLESIKIAEHHNTQNCLREMLKIWLNKINPPPSWSAITDALECLGEEQLARDLRSKI